MKKTFLFLIIVFYNLIFTSCSREDSLFDLVENDQEASEVNSFINSREFQLIKKAISHYRMNESTFKFPSVNEIPQNSIKWGISRLATEVWFYPYLFQKS
jgi:PBP1b-binding outer membrane lipoprotein LpoB